MRSEKEAIFVKTILYADVLANAVQNLPSLPPTLVGPLKAYLECREVNGHLNTNQHGGDGLQYKNGIN